MELPEIKALPPMPTLPPMVMNSHTVPMVQVGTKSSVLEFESPNEFTQYMQENPSKFIAANTRVLNNTYRIPGYVIRQNNERTQLTLVPEIEANRYKKPPKQDIATTDMIMPLNEQVEELTRLLNETRQEVFKTQKVLKTMITTLNQHSSILEKFLLLEFIDDLSYVL